LAILIKFLGELLRFVTIEAWAYSRTSNTGIERSVLTSRPDSYRWGYMFYQSCYQDNWELWLLPPNGDYQKIRGPKVQANVWTHLAATYDPGLWVYY
jgi:hypothetical protein